MLPTTIADINVGTCAGVLSIIAGTVGTFGDVDGVGTQAQFSTLRGIAVSPVTGFVYVVDANKVKQINPDTGMIQCRPRNRSIGSCS